MCNRSAGSKGCETVPLCKIICPLQSLLVRPPKVSIMDESFVGVKVFIVYMANCSGGGGKY